MKLAVIDFIKSVNNWQSILSTSPYNISIKEDDNYYLLKYNQIESDFTLDVVKECRGLIIRKSDYTPVSLSFTKFFNNGEPNASFINWKTAQVQEKIDGSLMRVWYDDGWHLSTSGTIDAFKANVSDLGYTFGDLFVEALAKHGFSSFDDFTTSLDKEYCYTFELVSPKAPIVISYKDTDIYYIGKRDMETLEELIPQTAPIADIKMPKLFKLKSLENCLAAASKLGLKQEGFVVVDNKFRRIKIKGPDYLIAHYLRNNGAQSNSKLLDIVERNEIEEVCSYFPVWREKLEDIKERKENFINEVRDGILSAMDFQQACLDDNPQKAIALFIKDFYPDISGFIFDFLHKDMIRYFIDNEWSKLPTDRRLKYLKLKVEDVPGEPNKEEE